MKIKLNVLERIQLLNILPPAEGNFVTYRMMVELKKVLSFTEKEIKKFEIKTSQNQIIWKYSEDKELGINDTISTIILSRLEGIDREGKINEQNGSLFEKFGYEKYLETHPKDEKESIKT